MIFYTNCPICQEEPAQGRREITALFVLVERSVIACGRKADVSTLVAFAALTDLPGVAPAPRLGPQQGLFCGSGVSEFQS